MGILRTIQKRRNPPIYIIPSSSTFPCIASIFFLCWMKLGRKNRNELSCYDIYYYISLCLLNFLMFFMETFLSFVTLYHCASLKEQKVGFALLLARHQRSCVVNSDETSGSPWTYENILMMNHELDQTTIWRAIATARELEPDVFCYPFNQFKRTKEGNPKRERERERSC